MGLYDRDYARSRGPGFPGASALSMTTRLIVANVVLWFLFAGALRFGGPRGSFFSFLYETFPLHTDAVFAKLKLWQLFTAFWFHDPSGLGHIFFNMLFLFFFGRVVEQMIGGRGLFRLYLAGGFASTLAMIPLAWLQGAPIVGFGASGCVYAIGVFAALRVPNLQVIFFVVPMPLWVMVTFFMVGREVANLLFVGTSVGTSVGHLAGAAAGWVYHRRRRSAVPGAGSDWIGRMRRKVEAGSRERQAVSDAQRRERVDALLEKIHQEGMSALTKEEKDFLQEASSRLQGR